MGNQCGKSKQQKNSRRQLKLNKPNQNGKNEQITEDTTNNIQQQYYQPREGTVTSYEDIRQIYNFGENVIGCGQFGAVRLATLKSDPSKVFAVKTISKHKVKRELHLLKTELEILKTLDHPNIITFFETYQDTNFFHIVMEYCEGGELFERIVTNGHLREKEAVVLLQKIFSAVKYLHEHGIIHRDLKPENFLFKNKNQDSEIKIIDFGLSWQVNNPLYLKQKQNTIVGTSLYIAPEALDGSYDFSCDMWSLGIITYILLCGNAPFKGKTDSELFEKIKNGEINYDVSDWKHISKNAKDFVSKLLVTDPQKRLSAQEAFQHPWLKQKIKEHHECKDIVDPQIFNIMKNFRSAGRFKKEVLKIIVNQLSEGEIRKLRSNFRNIDVEKKGIISLQQMRTIMQQMGHYESDNQIQNMLKTFNLDSNAKNITYKTFIGACLDKNVYFTEERLYPIFKQLDLDNTGFITKDNLETVMTRYGRKLEDQDLEKLIQDFDITQNNKISFEEFVTIMTLDKDEDLQSVRESWYNMDVTERRVQNQSYGHLGLEISNQNIRQSESSKDNQELQQQIECEINIVQPEINNTNNNTNNNSNIRTLNDNNGEPSQLSLRNTSVVKLENALQFSNSAHEEGFNRISTVQEKTSQIRQKINTNETQNQMDLMASSKNGYNNNTNNNLSTNTTNINGNNKMRTKDIAEVDNSFWGRGIEEGNSPGKVQTYFKNSQ